ncbi:hypothetical protein [Acrocarpospora sp. B8E8]|uniref:hypothetical protein n=1 Tax=Acrocarpospora sp. B8E8 TaxID=3153572 RepID=UPI00325E3293
MNWFSPPASPAGLIGQTGTVSLGARGPLPRPGIAMVYATRTGDAVAITGRPSWFDAHQYHLWYEVDISRHLDSIQADLSSAVDSMQFRLHADLSWEVSDPITIVRRATTDGLVPLRAWLIDQAWRVTRGYDIERCGDAEIQLRGRFEQTPIVLDEGITVHRVNVRLQADDATAQFDAERVALIRAGKTEKIAFGNQIEQQEHAAQLERDQVKALRQLAQGEDDLIFLFLARHPDQVGAILEQVAKRQEISVGAQMSLFNKLVDKGFIQEADIENARQSLLRPIEQLAGTRPGAALGGRHQQAAVEPPRPAAAPRQAAPAQEDGITGWVKFGKARDDEGDQ